MRQRFYYTMNAVAFKGWIIKKETPDNLIARNILFPRTFIKERISEAEKQKLAKPVNRVKQKILELENLFGR